MALQRLLVLENWLQRLVADGYLCLALVALWRRQAEGKVGPALRTVVPVVLLHVPILSTPALSLDLLYLLTIFVCEGGLRAFRTVFLPETDNLRKRRVVLDCAVLLEGESKEVCAHGIG